MHDCGWQTYRSRDEFDDQDSFAPQISFEQEEVVDHTQGKRPSKFDLYLRPEFQQSPEENQAQEVPKKKQSKKVVELNTDDELDLDWALNAMAGFNRQSSAPPRLEFDDEFLDFEEEDRNTIRNFVRQNSAPVRFSVEDSLCRLKDMFGSSLNVKNTFLDFGDGESKKVGAQKRSPSV